jgi:hypothetical protein
MARIDLKNDGKLFINHFEVNLPHRVIQVEEIKNQFFVMVEAPLNITYNRNIFALNEEGEILWQIEECPHGGDREKSYFTIIHDGSGGLVAETGFGINYQINLDYGSVTAKSFDRF